MTPKDKADELIYSFYRIIPLDKMTIDFQISKKCALIAVDEIIKALPPFTYGLQFVAKIEFWNKVKKEIELL